MLAKKGKKNILIAFLFLFLFILFQKYNIVKENFTDNSNKYACIYAYYEKDNNYKENFEYFLDNVVSKRSDIDYYLVINGKYTVELPDETSNIKIIKRQNKGFDFGAWSHCVKKYIKKPYDYYIFLNTSVKGPYPSDTDWLVRFIDLFKSGPGDIKLVGTSINVLPDVKEPKDIVKKLYNYPPPYTHVQSMFFILNNDGYNILLTERFFDDENKLNNTTDLQVVVLEKEIRMSQILLKKGYNINSILSKYRDKDYTKITTNFNTSGDDPYYKGAYFGSTITKEEAIFFKTNRNMI